MRVLYTVLFLSLIGLVQCQALAKLEEKVQIWQNSIFKSPYLKLDYDKWRSLVRSTPRNYTVVVMFTALGAEHNCQICQQAHEEFIIAANSYRYAYSNNKKLYFALVDYEFNPEAFHSMQLKTAPVIYLFHPRANTKPEQMDFNRQGFGADAIAKFVQDNSDVVIRVMRPPNYAGPLVVFLLVMLVLGMLYLKRESMDFVYSTTFWGFCCVVFVIAFMSGQMWNHIRSPPFLISDPRTKQTMFVHHSAQYQLIGETYIVFGLYALVSTGVVLLYESTKPGKPERFLARKYQCYTGIFLVCIFFSLLLSVFRSKYGGYPYHFLFQ